ncbi:MAG TPA: glucans biosynthesis glucosyltransferase MdoH, partial [Janthinobacterium sp.]|nr:glucans biosynthesis glucosyltransferase MdoH [Janthinobacterium sp.]
MSAPTHETGSAKPRRAGMPPIVRGAMVAQPWRGFFRSLAGAGKAPAAAASDVLVTPAAPWERAARRRRRALLAMIGVATLFATVVFSSARPGHAYHALQWLQVALFALLFAWVSAGCFTAVMGFFVLLRGDRHMLSKNSAGNLPLGADARTAIIMPICNEDV